MEGQMVTIMEQQMTMQKEILMEMKLQATIDE